ncbi:MAG TPA: PilZ domain-containing protein [Terriglobales bacterium]|nr:PilZ domain-containing protein [Terriglobales bacterium]
MRGSAMAATSNPTIAPVEQFSPRPYRHKLRSLAYVNLGSTSAAILRDLGQSGLAMQTARPMPVGEQVELRLDLPAPRTRLEAVGRIVWTDSSAQAGVEFVSLSTRSQQALSEWIFAQLLSDAGRVMGEGELLFSTAARPAIQMPSFLPVAEDEDDLPRLRLLGFAVSARRFARIVDSLVLLCAVLLFSLMSLFLIDILPSWPFTIAFLLAATAMFAGLYWLVFVIWFGATPGKRLAALAGASSSDESMALPVQSARFR